MLRHTEMTTDLDLAASLAAGHTPDVVLLGWAAKKLPDELQLFHSDLLASLQLVRGLVRIDKPVDAARLDLLRRFEQAARGHEPADMPENWRTMLCGSPALAAMSASLLQAAQRELAFALRSDQTLFPTWSDFYNHVRFSTVPVGRALLSHVGISASASFEATDALMTALALTAALQAAPDTYRQTRMVGLPLQWLSGEVLDGDALGQRRSSKAMRKVFVRGADRAFELLAIAGPTRGLPEIGSYAAAISLLCRRLLRRMQRRDALARPVTLGLWDRLALRLANIR